MASTVDCRGHAQSCRRTVLTLTDDSQTTVTLPFALPYPTGSTTQRTVCSNGFVSAVSTNGSSLTPSAAHLLSAGPRF